MNRSRLIWGVVCLVLAGVLLVLNLALPPDQFMFMVGKYNIPYLPVVALLVVGVVLLATAGKRGEEQQPTPPAPPPAIDPEKAALNKRLETMAWGLFLIMLGGFMFIPETVISKGAWSIGVGIIMLGLNAVRYTKGIKMSGFTTFLGIISLIGGVLQIIALQNAEGAILLIVLGAYLIVKPWFDKRKLFGKAEEV